MNKLPPLLPYLVVSDGDGAIAFYKKAFGAVEDEAPHYAPGTKKVLNSRMNIRGSVFMLCDDFKNESTLEAVGGPSVMLHLSFDEGIDEAFAQAISAGATAKMPLADMFWGDRYGQLKDPFGHMWTMGQKVAVLSAEEIEEGAKAAFSK